MIAVNKISVGANHRELSKDGIADLAASIRGSGLLQPIGVRKHPTVVGEYVLVWGRRRLEALKQLNTKEIADELVVVVSSDVPDDELRVIENLHRRELTLDEQISAVDALVKSGRTLDSIAAHIGHSAQWVARRANLTKLCKKMREHMRDEGWYTKFMTIAHWEEVAAYPEEMQESMYMNDVADAAIGTSVATFVKKMRERYALRLKLAKWPLDKTHGGICRCDKCPKRSSQREYLFAEIASDDDRCLDVECWKKKQAATVEAKVKELSARGNVLKVSSRREWDCNRLERELYGAGVLYKDGWTDAKKNNGTPAVLVDGSRAGEVVYVSKTSGSARKSTPGKNKDATLDEKRATLQILRNRIVCTEVVRLLKLEPGFGQCEDEYKKERKLSGIEMCLLKRLWPRYATEPLATTLLVLLSVFGSRAGVQSSAAGQFVLWCDLDKWASEDDRKNDLLNIAWAGVFDKLRGEMSMLTRAGHPTQQDMAGVWFVCDMLGMDRAALEALAVERKPEPKSWKSKMKTMDGGV